MLYWFLLTLNLILWVLLAYFQWDNDWRAKADQSPLFKSPILHWFFAGCQLVIMFGPVICAWRYGGLVHKGYVLASVVVLLLIMNITWHLIGNWRYEVACLDYMYVLKKWRNDGSKKYVFMTDVDIEEEARQVVLQNAKDNRVFDDEDDEQVKPVTHL